MTTGDHIHQHGTFGIGYQKNIQQKGSIYISNATASSLDEATVGLNELLNALKTFLPTLPLGESAKSQVVADVNTLQAQLSSSKPNAMIIKESSRELYDLLMGIASNAAWTGLSTLLAILAKVVVA